MVVAGSVQLPLAASALFFATVRSEGLSSISLSSRSTGSNGTSCTIDQSQPPSSDLTLCGNSTLFSVWRPKARFIPPEGWSNDPQGLFQLADSSFHIGYQCNPQHINWGNISQCAAFSKDLTYFTDANSWQNPKTLWPSELYDIRGVFDGSIIKDGWEGFPTTIYASTYPGGPLGSTVNEVEGVETVSLAYTPDGGHSWTKLPFGSQGNPVIYKWPQQNLAGFRDPYAFQSPVFSSVLGDAFGANGPNFLTMSGGVKEGSNVTAGPMIFLYRQTDSSDLRGWTYLGPLLTAPAGWSFSEWSGNVGINFETVTVTRLNEQGAADDDGANENAMDIVFMGTELGRNGSHENHWPLWASVTLGNNTSDGSFGKIDFAGVGDWGRTYAFACFPVQTEGRNRSVLVGWTYEDDEDLVLTHQRGYQGAFTLFRDLYLKVIRNVDPTFAGLNETGSWTVRTEADGSTSVVTVGQTVIPETLSAYQSSSVISKLASRNISINGTDASIVAFDVQPKDRYYAVSGTLRFDGDTRAGFRVLASDQEWTDIWFDSSAETLNVQRTNSSLISTYGTELETGKLRLWPILNTNGTGSTRQELNLTVFVDNSVVEVYANDVTVITTRVYPWLSSSLGVSFLAAPTSAGVSGSVEYSNVELWDGLINAWPERPEDTTKPLLWDGPIAGIWGLWDGR